MITCLTTAGTRADGFATRRHARIMIRFEEVLAEYLSRPLHMPELCQLCRRGPPRRPRFHRRRRCARAPAGVFVCRLARGEGRSRAADARVAPAGVLFDPLGTATGRADR